MDDFEENGPDDSSFDSSSSSNSTNNTGFSQGFFDLTKSLGTTYLTATSQQNQSTQNGLLTAANAQATAAQQNAALITKVMLGLGAAVLVIGVLYTLKSK